MDDLISEFITEATESISLLDSEMVKLEQNPENAAILGNISRIMHTIKGTCGFLGLPRLESVAHASKNVLEKILNKQLQASSAAVTLILESLDNIKILIEHLSKYEAEPKGDDSDLIARLNHFAETGIIGGGRAANVASHQPAPIAMAPAAKTNTAKTNGITKPSCLIVDDSKVVRTLEKKIVTDLGFTTCEAENGHQAVEACTADMPNLILLDWHMPVMNGLEFIKALRTMPNGAKPKVVFCTTESEISNIMQAIASGADEYVMKPFDAEIIKGKLQQIGALEI